MDEIVFNDWTRLKTDPDVFKLPFTNSVFLHAAKGGGKEALEILMEKIPCEKYKSDTYFLSALAHSDDPEFFQKHSADFLDIDIELALLAVIRSGKFKIALGRTNNPRITLHLLEFYPELPFPGFDKTEFMKHFICADPADPAAFYPIIAELGLLCNKNNWRAFEFLIKTEEIEIPLAEFINSAAIHKKYDLLGEMSLLVDDGYACSLNALFSSARVMYLLSGHLYYDDGLDMNSYPVFENDDELAAWLLVAKECIHPLIIYALGVFYDKDIKLYECPKWYTENQKKIELYCGPGRFVSYIAEKILTDHLVNKTNPEILLRKLEKLSEAGHKICCNNFYNLGILTNLKEVYEWLRLNTFIDKKMDIVTMLESAIIVKNWDKVKSLGQKIYPETAFRIIESRDIEGCKMLGTVFDDCYELAQFASFLGYFDIYNLFAEYM